MILNTTDITVATSVRLSYLALNMGALEIPDIRLLLSGLRVRALSGTCRTIIFNKDMVSFFQRKTTGLWEEVVDNWRNDEVLVRC